MDDEELQSQDPRYQQVPGVPVPVPTEAYDATPITGPAQPPPPPGLTPLDGAMGVINAAGGLEARLADRYIPPSTSTRGTVTERVTTPLDPEAVRQAGQAAAGAQDDAYQAMRTQAEVQGEPLGRAAEVMNTASEARLRTQFENDVQRQGSIDRQVQTQRQVEGLLNQARSPAVRGALFEGPGGGGRALSMGIGMLFSGLGGLATGNPEAVTNFVDGIIERNLQDQIRERDNNYQNAEARNSLFSMAERELGSRQAATEASRAAMYDFAIEKIRSMMTANMPKEALAQVETQIAALQAARAQAQAASVASAATRTEERVTTSRPGYVRRVPDSTVLGYVNAVREGANQTERLGIARNGQGSSAAPLPVAHGMLGPTAMADRTIMRETVNQIQALDVLRRDVTELESLRRQWDNMSGTARATEAGSRILARGRQIAALVTGRINQGLVKFGALSGGERELIGEMATNPTAAFSRSSSIQALNDGLMGRMRDEYRAMEAVGRFRQTRDFDGYGNLENNGGTPGYTGRVPVTPE